MTGLLDPTQLEPLGLGWQPRGHSVLWGSLLQLAQVVDAKFVELAQSWGASEYRFPPFIAASELHKLDYFRSFPHLVTFPVSLDAAEANLESFVQSEILGADGALQLPRLSLVQEALTPAACYHVYIQQQGRRLDGPSYHTTINTCFRREQYYEPLRRQWSFSMREVVCIGSLQEVQAFLEECRGQVQQLLRAVGLSVEWQVATDPFFQPTKNAKYIAQRVNPTKQEAVFGGNLAIASVNLHQDHFGHTFDITRAGDPAFSGCVAFGIERWLYAVLAQHGLQASSWPEFSVGFQRSAQHGFSAQRVTT